MAGELLKGTGTGRSIATKTKGKPLDKSKWELILGRDRSVSKKSISNVETLEEKLQAILM